MPEDYYSSPTTPARKSGGTVRTVLGTAVLAFLGGGALVMWLLWNGQIALPGVSDAQTPPTAMAIPSPTTSAAAANNALMEQQIAALEQRLARIDLQAAAAEGNTARAEALLVALAARRAIEHGTELGYLEDQLRLRFSAARPAAVNTVIEVAKAKITLDSLLEELEQLAPQLTGSGPEDTGWVRFKRQFTGLFVIHRDNPGADVPETRLARAQLLLRTGQIDEAVAEIAKLPGAKIGEEWIAKARRYSEAMQALDQIEQAALAEPEKLKAGTGEDVRQPGPAVSPSPTGTPAPAQTPARQAKY